ncbi:MAG TPA: glycosyltransferase family 39 protein [Candidatus Eisenbacteria bacterium]
MLYAVALGLRVLYAWLATGPHATPSSDSAEYDAVAWHLARGQGFSLDAAAGPYPTAFVPPLLPWLTSLVYGAFGHHFFASILLQCAIGALVPLLLAAFGGSLFGGNVGRTAGWLAAAHPLLVFFSGYLLTETAFTALLLVALSASAAWVRTPQPGRALGVGVTWGLASLTRPTALLLPAVVAAWAWVSLGLALGGRARLRHIALLGLGLALSVGPWTLRNALVLHAFVPVTTGGGRALLDSNNPEVWNDPARRGGAMSTTHVEPYASETRGLGEPEADAAARRRALQFLAAHVREWPAMAAAKLARFWRVTAEGGGTGAWQREGSTLGRALRAADPLLVWSLLTWPFALWGLFRTLRGPRRFFQGLGLLVVLYFSAIAVVYWGALRMRVPVEPMIVLFAAVGIEDALRRLRARGRGLRVVLGGTRS